MSITLGSDGARQRYGVGGAAVALGIAIGASFALAITATVAVAVRAAVEPVVRPAVEHSLPAVTAGVSPLDQLRVSAALGDVWASRTLVAGLLDRYDGIHDEQALVEAVLWFDRDWDTVEYLNSPLAGRLLERECGHPALRWHWLCMAGE